MPYLLLVHMLCAVAPDRRAITHQTLGLIAPVKATPHSFFGRFRAVNGAVYVNAIIVLFVIVNILGWIIYPNYRIGARINMTDLRLFKQVGAFDLKENMMALGLAMLPSTGGYGSQPMRRHMQRHARRRRSFSPRSSGTASSSVIISTISQGSSDVSLALHSRFHRCSRSHLHSNNELELARIHLLRAAASLYSVQSIC